MLRVVKNAIRYTIGGLFHNTEFINIVIETVGTRLTSTLQERVEKQEEKINGLESVNSLLSLKLDMLEQCTRRNNLRFFGIPENGNENLEATLIQLCSEKLQIQLSPENIDFCRRIGERKKRGSRAVIVKFVSHKVRSEIYNNKKRFKGSRITVTEDLIKSKYHLLIAATSKFGKHKVWTRNGSILARTEHGIKNINFLSDLETP